MRRETVVRVEELHASRGAVREVAERPVPRGLIRRRAEEFETEVGLQKIVVHDFLVITEIAEFVPFCLE